jgi:dynein heavy chain 1
LTEYLSTADDWLSWQSKSLPADNLTTENAIMLKRFNRYPLMIDPTGQATTFLLNEYKERKITVTSFLDEAFLKVLESALRFGNSILTQDVEHLDPILNAVLNKEIRGTGGRVLIHIGNQDIDFSPAFTMFLSTRDPSVEFSPDSCSRVTLVNFTMTRSGLQSQSLDQVLKVERPDTERKRTDLMKAQGEFRIRLRTLEKSLLQALNESTGNLLDDDKVIGTSETLKREATESTQGGKDGHCHEGRPLNTCRWHRPAVQSSSFSNNSTSSITFTHSPFRQFFLDIFDYVLHHNSNLKNVTDYHRRREILLNDLFLVAYRRTSRVLLHRDHVMLFFWHKRSYEVWRISPTDSNSSSRADKQISFVLSPEQMMHLEEYAKQSLFSPENWVPFLQSANPETIVPLP